MTRTGIITTAFEDAEDELAREEQRPIVQEIYNCAFAFCVCSCPCVVQRMCGRRRHEHSGACSVGGQVKDT